VGASGVLMKKCTRCKVNKELLLFNKDKSRSDGYDASCKECKSKSKKKEYIENKEEYLAKVKIYDAKNYERRKDYWPQWRKANPDKNTAICKTWRSKNMDKIREYYRGYYSKNLNRRISNRLSSDIRDCLSGRKNRRHWQDLVGYTLEALKSHIETQFQPGMTWDNWGRGENCWHIDHKTPQSWFDFSDESQIKQCWRLDNLTCKWEFDNLSKGNRSED